MPGGAGRWRAAGCPDGGHAVGPRIEIAPGCDEGRRDDRHGRAPQRMTGGLVGPRFDSPLGVELEGVPAGVTGTPALLVTLNGAQ